MLLDRLMIVDRERIERALAAYQIGQRLGSGRFGLVVAGRHRQLRRPVAIKVMEAEGPEGLTVDFAVEARILAGFDHSHVVRIFEYVEAEGLCLLVMELLDGGTLTRRRDSLDPAQACAVGLAVAAALEHAHGRGVLHRDIKGDNILFAADGTVKVTDFGIAKLFEGSAATASGLAGTPMYMAPEQIEGGRLSPATDLYALGVVLYRLLAGVAPFDPQQPVQALWRQHLLDPPPPLEKVPTPIAAVVLRALAKDPADRPVDAVAFAVDLARAATGVYGPGWTEPTGLPLHLAADIRRLHELPPPLPPRPRSAAGPLAAPELEPTDRSVGPQENEPPPADRLAWLRQSWIGLLAVALAIVLLGVGCYVVLGGDPNGRAPVATAPSSLAPVVPTNPDVLAGKAMIDGDWRCRLVMATSPLRLSTELVGILVVERTASAYRWADQPGQYTITAVSGNDDANVIGEVRFTSGPLKDLAATHIAKPGGGFLGKAQGTLDLKASGSAPHRFCGVN
ncbi:eukaryotic-like serine/threonine-protein kinase [Frankia sp. AiPs1]|uniref:serine/threonine-protein kinase n=1 Tax=Frankia sp. AiPa1 TaxID=573492 RepID=UPI00202B9071|nr:serine/threonine-protein kinase [Frankia sp. AiPa1]MCL9762641.1 serine/threonine protein kinase [Frankia sp. AiPa1]